MPRPDQPDPVRPENPLDLRALAPPPPPPRTMTGGEVTPNADELRAAAGPSGGRGVRDPGSTPVALLAWLVALAVALFVFGNNNAADLHAIAPSVFPAPQTQPADALAGPDLQSLLMGRYIVGAGRMLQGLSPTVGEDLTKSFTDTARAQKRDPLALVRAAVVEGELIGHERAMDLLDEAETAVNAWADVDAQRAEPAARMLEDVDALRTIYTRGAGALAQDRTDALVDRHAWFGRLALAHGLDDADPARAPLLAQATRTAASFLTAVGVVILAVLTGIVLCIVALVMRSGGKLRARYASPAPGGSVYVEVFALFLVGFLGVSLLAGVIEKMTGHDLSMTLIWLLLLTPGWALLRGAPVRNWRYALGLHSGNGAVREVAAGVVGYIGGLPIVALGVGCTLLLMTVSGLLLPADEAQAPSHPVVDQIAGGSAGAILAIYLLACVWAPVVEELVFRGALYHHLRGRFVPLFSAIVVAFLFAAIHPQGWVAIPALMSLALVFAFLREWRGSLIAPIVAHALNNGFVITMLVVAVA